MRRVIIESPYAGDIHLNTLYARLAVKDCLSRGEAPIASHLLYTQPGILDDGKPDERKTGIDAGHAWIGKADAVVVYTDLGVSNGMAAGIRRAHDFDELSVEYRQIKGWDKAILSNVDTYQLGDMQFQVKKGLDIKIGAKESFGGPFIRLAERVSPEAVITSENQELHDQITALSDELQKVKDDLAEAEKSRDELIKVIQPFARSGKELANNTPPGLVETNVFVAVKNAGEGTGWNFQATYHFPKDLIAAAKYLKKA